MKNTDKPKLYCFLPLIYLITPIFSPRIIFADDLKSPAFEIQMSTINITGGAKTSDTYRLTDTIGQTFQGRFDSSGYVIEAGFQYINSIIPFSFKISNLDIAFGSLVPGTPSLLSNTLTVTTGSAFGYSVRTIEDHPLRRNDGVTTIPDTACDLATPCLPSDADIWADDTRYGFGYHMAGADVDTGDFAGSDYYRPFPVQNTDQPEVIMSKGGVATSSAATVTYKVNIGGNQAAGNYQNSIQFIAIPSF